MRVAIYCRISRDDKGEELGVQRQEEDCRRWCEEHGYEVVAVYIDNDISAMGTKRRPRYNKMLKGIQAREFDAVVAWHQDRITRSPREMEDYIITCSEVQGGMPTFTLNGGPLDLTTAEGRMQARFGVMIAQYYVEHNAYNARRALKQKRKDGEVCYKRSYGWRRADDGKSQIQVPEEASVIRRMHTEYQTGKSARRISDDLNAEGITTLLGNEWTGPSVGQQIRRALHAGLNEHFPDHNHVNSTHQPVQDEVYEANVDKPIVDRETWEMTVHLLSTKDKKSQGKKTSQLLNTIMKCNECGNVVTSQQ